MVLGPIVASSFGMEGISGSQHYLVWLGNNKLMRYLKHFLCVKSRDNTDPQRLGYLLREPSLMRLNLGIFFLHLTLMAAFVVIP